MLGDINISKLFKSKQDEKKKTVEKVSAIILEAVANKEDELKNKLDEGSIETDAAVETVLDEINNA